MPAVTLYWFWLPSPQEGTGSQLAFPLFAVLLVFNYFLFSQWFSIPVVCPVAERLLDVVLVVLAYRVLMRELERYRSLLDYLAKYASMATSAHNTMITI